MSAIQYYQERITELEGDLLEAKSNSSVYVHETNTLHCVDGELHMQYGDINEEKTIVFNVTSLFADLPCIIEMVSNENNKNTKEINDRIKKMVKDL